VNKTGQDLCLTCDHLTPSVIFGVRGHPPISRPSSSEPVSVCRRIPPDRGKLRAVAVHVAIHSDLCPLCGSVIKPNLHSPRSERLSRRSVHPRPESKSQG
jgi:hypothetical protein